MSNGLAWLSLTARRGVVAAQKDLAVWYATHVTRQRDNFKAYFWLRSAKLTKADLGPLAQEITRRVWYEGLRGGELRRAREESFWRLSLIDESLTNDGWTTDESEMYGTPPSP